MTNPFTNKGWDGAPRIGTWGRDLLGADYAGNLIARSWILGAVDRARKPGSQVPIPCIKLRGEFERGKNVAALMALGGELYFDREEWHSATLAAGGIVDLSLESDETVRRAISGQTHCYTACVFAIAAGTQNKDWHAIDCARVDIAAIYRQRDQLWAEAWEFVTGSGD